MDTVATQLKLALLAISLLLLPFLQATDFKYCVVSGKPATFSISASTGQAISGGKAVIDVSYFGFHIHQETHPLCEETSCPIAVGNFVLSHNQVLPGFTPPILASAVPSPWPVVRVARNGLLNPPFMASPKAKPSQPRDREEKGRDSPPCSTLVTAKVGSNAGLRSKQATIDVTAVVADARRPGDQGSEASGGRRPKGSYKLKMTLTGEGILQLTCILFDFKIGFGASGFLISDA
ncbi:hypothetical protein Goshw_016938 [Gossypium schwendimanii]|uniref:MD-2-related lipid-recognition domain-containing protein n=1 Tax=Gossypium schwendimanii TaxID=34291 RepID=A0A7J9MZY4_GOSSC|nr:hypothetical protein [Gossypium schwendimanii]